jgi:hypothetical protein
MRTDVFGINVDNTQDIRLHYTYPSGDLNWGIDLAGSDVVNDVTTPLVLFLNDYPGDGFASHDGLLQDLAETYAQIGLPSLSIEYRGCGLTSQFAEHFTFRSAMRDIEVALSWAMREKDFTAIIPVTAGVSSLIALRFIEGHGLRYMAKSQNYADEKSLVSNLQKEGGAENEKGANVKGIQDLRLLGMIMFWPWLDRASNAFVHSCKDLLVSAESKDGKSFEDIDRNDISARIGGNEYKVGLKFLKQVIEEDALGLVSKLPCPAIIQHGTDDEITKPIPLDVLKGHVNNAYLDYQTYKGHGNGLTAPSLRPVIKSITADFIKRFS